MRVNGCGQSVSARRELSRPIRRRYRCSARRRASRSTWTASASTSPFGDVVSWDLIPRIAIASTTLMPGSNPLFGLNTLGGAPVAPDQGRHARIPGTMRAGQLRQRRAPGGRVRARRQPARRAAELVRSPATLFGEDGWRDDSPSDVRQIFGEARLAEREERLVASRLAHADNVAERQRRCRRPRSAATGLPRSVYTKPDITDNRSTFRERTAAPPRAHARRFRQRLLPRHPARSTLERRHQRGLARPESSIRARAEQAALTAAGYTDFRPAALTPRTRRSPAGAASPGAAERRARRRSATACMNRAQTGQHNCGAFGPVTLPRLQRRAADTSSTAGARLRREPRRLHAVARSSAI